MRIGSLLCAAVAAAMLPTAVLADDPHDPAMRNAAARERDRQIIRELNRKELAMVRERDARYAEGWRAARENGGYASDYADSLDDHRRAVDDYARSRARYERDMAAWRRAVAACRAGDYSACD